MFYNKTFTYPNNLNYKFTFKGVSLGDFDSNDSFDYTNSSAGEDEDVAKKFEISLKNIKDNCKQKKDQVKGFLKKRKKQIYKKKRMIKLAVF